MFPCDFDFFGLVFFVSIGPLYFEARQRQEGVRVAEMVDISPQNPHAKGVKRRDFRFILAVCPSGFRKEFGDPLLHFLCRFVGEGDGEDAAWLDPASNQPGNAVGHHPGLPGPRPGQNQKRPPKRFNSSSLSGIE